MIRCLANSYQCNKSYSAHACCHICTFTLSLKHATTDNAFGQRMYSQLAAIVCFIWSHGTISAVDDEMNSSNRIYAAKCIVPDQQYILTRACGLLSVDGGFSVRAFARNWPICVQHIPARPHVRNERFGVRRVSIYFQYFLVITV